jgi:hypothetical protein
MTTQTNNISITKNNLGYYVISALINGYREQRVYSGYTKKDAIRLFKNYYKEGLK